MAYPSRRAAVMSAGVMALMPFPVHVPGDDPGPKGDVGENGGLGRSVIPLDVGGRIPLCIPEALGFGQGVVVTGRRLAHTAQDEIRGAVDDAHDAPDPFTGERLPQRADKGNSPRHGGLEQQIHPGGRRRLE